MNLFFLLIVFSLSAFAQQECDTAEELMSFNLTQKQFVNLCPDVIKGDPKCKGIDPKKIMSCSSKAENDILSSSKLLAKAGQCLKGLVWDSLTELVKFVGDLIKFMVNANVKSYVGLYKFMTDSEFRNKAITSSQMAATKGGRMTKAFLNSSAMYFSREFPKNLARNRGNPTLAIGSTLYEPLKKFVIEAVEGMVEAYAPQYTCMNGAGKLNTWCKLAGDFVMPPAFLFTWLKFGVKGLKMLEKTQSLKIAKFKKMFAEMNLVPTVPKPKKASLVVKETPKPKVNAEDLSDQQLVSLARNAKAESTASETQRVSALLKSEKYKSVLKNIDEDKAKNILNDLDSSAPEEALQILKTYEPEYARVLGSRIAPDEASASLLSQYIKKQKAKGSTDQAIKARLDEALNCK